VAQVSLRNGVKRCDETEAARSIDFDIADQAPSQSVHQREVRAASDQPAALSQRPHDPRLVNAAGRGLEAPSGGTRQG